MRKLRYAMIPILIPLLLVAWAFIGGIVMQVIEPEMQHKAGIYFFWPIPLLCRFVEKVVIVTVSKLDWAGKAGQKFWRGRNNQNKEGENEERLGY